MQFKFGVKIDDIFYFIFTDKSSFVSRSDYCAFFFPFTGFE